MIPIDFKPLSEYVTMLNNGTPFSFGRYWDGEIECMINKKGLGYNCDGCHYTDELREALLKTIKNNYEYYHALNQPKNNIWTKNMQEDFENLLLSMGSKVKWYDFMVFQRAIETGTFLPVVRALKNRNVIFLGGKHFYNIKTILPNVKHIETPPIDAFVELDNIEKACKFSIDNEKKEVIILCLGMAANVFIDDMFPQYGKKITMLDMGSVWDAMLGHTNRQWIRNINQNVMRRNFDA
jgi:hypothetical protein